MYNISTVLNQSGMYKEGIKIEITPESLLEYNKERFWSKVDKKEEGNLCWVWRGSKSKEGYGVFYLDKKIWVATRALYVLNYGIDPGDLYVCHKCDNPSCCNPGHLFLGTNSENLIDMRSKDRQAKGETHGTKTKVGKYKNGSCSGRAKLCPEQVIEIRRLHKEEHISYRGLSEMYSMNKSSLHQLIKKITWAHIA